MGGTGGSRWKVQEGGGIGIHIANLLHCTVQTNTVLKNNYFPIKKGLTDKQKLKELSTTKPALQPMLRGLL